MFSTTYGKLGSCLVNSWWIYLATSTSVIVFFAILGIECRALLYHLSHDSSPATQYFEQDY
jgi:hypothetical protein